MRPLKKWQYDLTHGLIPILSYIIVAFILRYFEAGYIAVKLTYIIGTFLLISLQWWNEDKQKHQALIDGNYDDWRANSRIDWIYFVIGVFIGTAFFGAIL